MTELTVRRFPTRAALDAALEERLIAALASSAGAGAGAGASAGAGATSAIMLSGGTTPMGAYRAVATRLPTQTLGLQVFFSDERYVPADSERSNYRQAAPLLDALQQRGATIVRVPTQLTLEAATAQYEEQLAALLRSGTPIGLGLLGLGADGHTASLFSQADLQRARGRLTLSVQRPDGLSAVSVTPDLLERVDDLLFVTVSAGKEEALRRLQAGDSTLPAWQAVSRRPRTMLWVAETG
ncbi:MAG: 6-phosphogluconolactonase [Proteobacteria bacterium]|nr:6-phosphogluconolactonase [Pseudomonadota bacterium]